MEKQSNLNEGNLRVIRVDGQKRILQQGFVGNTVSSASYTWWSLIPQNLFEQFQRTSNLWFLLVSVFQLIPFNLNPTDSWSTIVPLVVLLTFTLFKDAYNDYHRKKQDQKINSQDYSVWNYEVYTVKKSREVQVGEFVLLQEGEIVPSDILLLATSGSGTCYVDVSSIAGLGNAQIKQAVQETQRQVNMADTKTLLRRLKGILKVQQPNPDFSRMNGSFSIKGIPKSIQVLEKNLLYRGSVIVGVPWVVGMVVYAGTETKTLLNTQRTRKKTSRIEAEVNIWVLFILLILLTLVVFSQLAYYFLAESGWNELSGLESFVVFTLLYNNIIPISLFVVMDLVRVIQVIVIQFRAKKRISFKTGDINEDLGQIEYILTDKTGTLTQRQITVRYCTVNGVTYQRDQVQEEHSLAPLSDQNSRSIKLLVSHSEQSPYFDMAKLKNSVLEARNIYSYHFVRCMALCHNLTTENLGSMKFIGTSSEEIALVMSAAELGVQFIQRNRDQIEIQVQNQCEIYQVQAFSPFQSESRCSRLLVRTGNKYFLYVKGAGDLLKDLVTEPSHQVLVLDQQVSSLSSLGMRTIVLAYKQLNKATFEQFSGKLETAKYSMINTQRRIDSVFQEYQNGLVYLGVAGIEEEVKQQTRQTLSSLKEAGIKIWVVSGDTQGSVISAALNASLIFPNTPIVALKQLNNPIQCQRVLKKQIQTQIYHDASDSSSRQSVIHRNISKQFHSQLRLNQSEDSFFIGEKQDKTSLMAPVNNAEAILAFHPVFKSSQDDFNIDFMNSSFNPRQVKFCMTIDRVSLRESLKSVSTRAMLVSLLASAQSVLCFNFLPQDKALIAKLIKENFSFKPVCLAIGDGNNDIAMLQQAHVGVGINSKQDLQAKLYSEIVVDHFSDLKCLLLAHGHWNYSRMSRTVLLFLYKNFILTVTTFFYIFISDFSGSAAYDPGLLVGYNIFFTTLPILVMGVFDEDHSSEQMFERPFLYKEGILYYCFNVKAILKYSFYSILHGVILALFLTVSFDRVLNDQGFTQNSSLFSTTLFCTVVFTVLLQISIDTYKISWLYLVSIVICIVNLVIVLSIFSVWMVTGNKLVGIGNQIQETPHVIIVISMTSFLCFILSYSIKIYLDFRAKNSRIWRGIFSRLETFSSGLSKVFKDSTFSNESALKETFQMKKYSLYFKSSYVEKTYRENLIRSNIRFYQFIIVFVWFLLLLWTLIQAFVLEAEVIFTLMRVLMSVAFTVVLFLVFTQHYKRNYIIYNLLVIYLGILLKFIIDIIFVRFGPLVTGIIPSVTYILFNVDFLKISFANLFSLIMFFVELIYYIFNTDQDLNSTQAVILVVSYMVLNIAITITSAYVGYILQKSRRQEHKLIVKKESSLVQTQNILAFLLPEFVRTRVKEGARYIAEKKGVVTVVFCDICDFDTICTLYPPNELTAFLDHLFQTFDQLCEQIGVSKIETVGKTYMACSGLSDFEQELDPSIRSISHARRAIEFAFNVLLSIKNYKLKTGKMLEVKIGINSGPVTAGVVGHHKPQFSLVGDTVNTASRMCSTITEPNIIQISTDTYDLLQDSRGLELKPNQVQPKGKGLLNTFLVKQAKIQDEDFLMLNQDERSGMRVSVLSGLSLIQKNTLIDAETPKADQKEGLRFSDRSFGVLENLNMTIGEQIFQKQNEELVSRVFDCSCHQTLAQKKFRIDKLKRNLFMTKLSMLVAISTFFIFFFLSLLDILVLQLIQQELIAGAYAIIILILTLLFLLLSNIYKFRVYSYLTILIMNIPLYTALLYIILSTSRSNDLVALQVMYVILLLNYITGASVFQLIVGNIMIFIPWLILLFFNSDISLHAANSLFVISFAVMNASAVYTRQIQLRTFNNLQALAQKQIDRTDQLLVQMMPPHVLDSMRQGRPSTDRLMNVTLLYADIVGFTAWSANKTPTEVVIMLSQMFTEFDKKCIDHQVYKVHTIGDCYVVMGYKNDTFRDEIQECMNVLQMAWSMIEIIRNFNEAHGSDLNMRIGLHTGEVIAGITGTHIVRYDIYGPDVLIANKMESNGESGKINVSDVTKRLIEEKYVNRFTFTFNQEVEAKAVNRSHGSFFIGYNAANLLS